MFLKCSDRDSGDPASQQSGEDVVGMAKSIAITGKIRGYSEVSGNGCSNGVKIAIHRQ